MLNRMRQRGSRGEAFAQGADAVSDARDALLLVADLPLDAQRPAIADLLQRLYKLLDVRLPHSQRYLLTPRPRRDRPVGVLDVDAANVRAEDLHSAQRISLVVEQHVG